MNARQQVLSSIEIRGPEAVWVLAAHAYATLVPLALCAAVYRHWDYVSTVTYSPLLFYIAAGLLCAGSAFEVAQNSFDRWYLTEDSPSANGTGFSDFLFYWLVTAGQATCAVAIGGDAWWVMILATLTVIALPICYLLQIAHFAPLSIASTLAICLAYVAFGDPVVFLQLLLAGVTMVFFAALLKTGAQFMHGFTTVAASSGVWFFVWALHSGAAGQSHSWIFVGAVAATAGLLCFVAWPALTSLPASRRVIRNPV